jgi:alkanesulfonate monooxygenase SsuD/methylene tetrahydromethanopterin reductase-like flavin-dependent oxidoreductase (luciferase family)
VADGYIATSSSGPAGLRRNWQIVQESAAAAGRPPGAVKLAALVRASVDEDVDRALARAEANARHYRPNAPEPINPASLLLGAPEVCIERALAYFEAGVEVLIVAPVTADLAHLDRLVGEVLTRL